MRWLLGLMILLTACAPVATPAPAATLAPTETPAPTETLTATPTITEPTPTPRVVEDVVERVGVDLEQGEMEVLVYLPRNYPNDAPYPALYLLHGQSADNDQWPDLGLMDGMDGYVAAGGQPFIVVMPEETAYLADPNDSTFDEQVDGLVAWADERYETCAERECRAIGGLSRGAAWAVRLGFTHPETFSVIGAHSLPPFFGDPGRLPTWLNEIPREDWPAVRIDVGRDDPYLKPAAEFQALLVQMRLPHEWQLSEGGHDAAYWSAQLPAYVAWYGEQFGKSR